MRSGLQRLWSHERQPGYGCHLPGFKRRSGKPLTRKPATDGSKTQKRKRARLGIRVKS